MPTRSPPVIPTIKLPPAPAVTLHRTPESDTHSVASPPLPPVRPRTLYPLPPYPAPIILMLLPPPETWFPLVKPLTAPTSADSPRLTDPPTTAPPVKESLRLPSVLPLILQVTRESDTQTVAPAPVHPPRPLLLNLLLPRSAPLSVKLLPPLDP